MGGGEERLFLRVGTGEHMWYEGRKWNNWEVVDKLERG